MRRTRIGILSSGSSFVLRRTLLAARRGELPGADMRVLVVGRPGTRAEAAAEEFGLPVEVVPGSGVGAERESYDRLLIEALKSHGVGRDGLVLLPGYGRLLSGAFLREYRGRVISVHPSLLPSFPGLGAVGHAYERGVKVVGCTVHFVVEQMDAGPIIAQAASDVPEGEGRTEMHRRVLKLEGRLFPKAVALFLEGRLSVGHGRVSVSGGASVTGS